jgi:hypothetical protein
LALAARSLPFAFHCAPMTEFLKFGDASCHFGCCLLAS